MYTGFGTKIKYCEPNILFSAARSLVSKSAGLLLPSQLKYLGQSREVKRIVNESLGKVKIEQFTDKKVKEALDIFINRKF